MEHERNGVLIPGEELDAAIGRLRESLSVLETIEDAELLAALPAQVDARVAHQRAVCMLAVLRRDLTALVQDMEAASATAALLAGVMARARQTPKR